MYNIAMQTRKLDQNEDMIFGHGNSDFLKGNFAILRMVKNTLLMTQGDWFLDRFYGIPYFSEPFLHEKNLPIITTVLKSAILNVSGVRAILDFITKVDEYKRTLSIDCTMQIDAGDTVTFNQSLFYNKGQFIRR